MTNSNLDAITANLGTDTRPAMQQLEKQIVSKAEKMLLKGKVPMNVDPQMLRDLFDKEDRPGYQNFQRVLHLAYHQTAYGKGNERHGSGKDWMGQSIMLDGRECGPGSMAFQVQKKAKEAARLAAKNKFDAAKTDILGAIVYAVAEYLLVEELHAASEKDDDELDY